VTGGPLQGRVAVVTGASSGIGAAVTRALAREEAHVALAARRNDALLEVQAGLEDGARSLVFPPTSPTALTWDLLSHVLKRSLGPWTSSSTAWASCTTPRCRFSFTHDDIFPEHSTDF
jgi:NAD(P)-dependent dehydrogenase (short-subunit alcohol dehydrogenase family)